MVVVIPNTKINRDLVLRSFLDARNQNVTLMLLSIVKLFKSEYFRKQARIRFCEFRLANSYTNRVSENACIRIVQSFSDNFSVLVAGSDALASCISVDIERL